MDEFQKLTKSLVMARQENETSQEKRIIKDMEIFILTQKNQEPYKEVYAFIDEYQKQRFLLDEKNIDSEIEHYRKKMIPLVDYIIKAAVKINP